MIDSAKCQRNCKETPQVKKLRIYRGLDATLNLAELSSLPTTIPIMSSMLHRKDDSKNGPKSDNMDNVFGRKEKPR